MPYFNRNLTPIASQVVEIQAPVANATEGLLRDIFREFDIVEDDTFADLLSKLDQIK